MRDCDQESTCYNTVISPIYFVSFVLTAQFVLVNVVIAVLMKHLEESNKEAKEEAELEAELELEMKTLSPQPHSPLGSPFLWPGVEGANSPGSPKPGAPHTTAHIGTASGFSLEHPTVSNGAPSKGAMGQERGREGRANRSLLRVYRSPAGPRASPPSFQPSYLEVEGLAAICPFLEWLPIFTVYGHPLAKWWLLQPGVASHSRLEAQG